MAYQIPENPAAELSEDGIPFQLKFVSEVFADHDYNVRPHQHCDYELIYLRKGQYEYFHNGFRQNLTQKQAVMLRPGDWHRDLIRTGTEYVAVNFVIRKMPIFLPWKKLSPEQLILTDTNGEIGNIICALCAENKQSDLFSLPLGSAYLCALCYLIHRKLLAAKQAENSAAHEERFADRFRYLVFEHIREFPSLENLAKYLGITPRTLNNYCKTAFSMSPMQIFMRIKMDNAKNLLTQTEMSVKEVSDYLGFQNPYHFSNVFKRIFRCSPSTAQKRSSRKPSTR